MNAVFLVLIIIANISLHEIGHAIQMRKYGVDIQEIRLIGLGRSLFKFKIRWLFGNVPCSIAIIPIGAFVRPTEGGNELMKLLPMNKYGAIMSAGIFMNLLITSIIFSLYAMLTGRQPSMFSLLLLLPIVFCVFPKYCWWVVGIGGIVMLYIIVHAFVLDTNNMTKDGGSIIYIIADSKNHIKSIAEVLKYGFVISLSMATFNSLPISPMDGGNIITHALKKIFKGRKLGQNLASGYAVTTMIILLVYLLWAHGKDLVNLF